MGLEPNFRYVAEHRGIPILLFSRHGKLFLTDLIEHRGAAMVKAYRAAGMGRPCPWREEDFTVTVLPETDGDGNEAVFIAVEMPEPEEITECRRVFLCCGGDGERRAYYTVEKSFACDMLCSWDAEGRHRDYGPAPKTAGEQLELVKKLFAK